MFTSEANSRRLTLLAGLALVVASTAAGQAPTKPPKDTAKKILIRKEQKAAGEVALPRVVTPTIPRCADAPSFCVLDPSHDSTIRADQFRLDSAMSAFQLQRIQNEMESRISVAREQSRVQTESAIRLQHELETNALRLRMARRGWYFGAAGGANAPQRYVRDGYTGGYNVTVPLGFDATNLPLGVRVDASVDHMNGTRVHDQLAQTTAASGDITVWSLNTDLKARVSAPGMTRTHLYALAGIGAHRVTGGVYGAAGTNAGNAITFANAGTKLGWNAGAGASFSWGPAELFVESRFMQVKTDYGYRMDGGLGRYTSFTPVVIGLQWF